MLVFILFKKNSLKINCDTPMHHRRVGVEFIGIIHAAVVYNPLNLKLVVIFIIIVGIT